MTRSSDPITDEPVASQSKRGGNDPDEDSYRIPKKARATQADTPPSPQMDNGEDSNRDEELRKITGDSPFVPPTQSWGG